MKLGGARTAIHDATAIHLTRKNDLDFVKLGTRIDRSSSGSNSGGIASAMEAGRILAEIDKQKPVVRYWLLYAYAAEPSVNYRAYVAHDLYNILFQEKKASAHDRLRRICGVSVDDLKHRLNCGRRLPAEWMAAQTLIRSDHWARDGARYVRECHALIDQWDRVGLCAVAQVIRRLRGLDEVLEAVNC